MLAIIKSFFPSGLTTNPLVLLSDLLDIYWDTMTGPIRKELSVHADKWIANSPRLEREAYRVPGRLLCEHATWLLVLDILLPWSLIILWLGFVLSGLLYLPIRGGFSITATWILSVQCIVMGMVSLHLLALSITTLLEALHERAQRVYG